MFVRAGEGLIASQVLWGLSRTALLHQHLHIAEVEPAPKQGQGQGDTMSYYTGWYQPYWNPWDKSSNLCFIISTSYKLITLQSRVGNFKSPLREGRSLLLWQKLHFQLCWKVSFEGRSSSTKARSGRIEPRSKLCCHYTAENISSGSECTWFLAV